MARCFACDVGFFVSRLRIGFKFFPDDSPPEAGNLDSSASAVLARSVEFIPLSSGPAGVLAGGAGVWNKMSTWSRVQFNREGMGLEDGRNARGTAEEVVYALWRRANRVAHHADPPPTVAFFGGAHAPPPATARAATGAAEGSGPVFRHRLADGTVLLSSKPPRTGPLVPPPPPARSAQAKFRADQARERAAMPAHDWNVLSLHEPVLNPYDPAQRARKEELARAAARAQAGLFGGLTAAERAARRNVERERMVYEDCNAIGAVRPSSYRFVPKIPNRNLFPPWAAFGAGAGGAHASFAAYAAATVPPGALAWATAMAGDPKAAWKAHTALLARERGGMRAADVDALTGVAHAPPEHESALARRARTKQGREGAAMAKADVNAVCTGAGVRQAIGAGVGARFSFATLRGATYPAMKPYKSGRSLCPHAWGQTANKHPARPPNAKGAGAGARYYKRKFYEMRGMLDAADGDADGEGAVIPGSAYAHAHYLARHQSHGQAQARRARHKYRYVDWGGGWTGVSLLPPLGAGPAAAPPNLEQLLAPPPEAPRRSRAGRPVKSYTTASSKLALGAGPGASSRARGAGHDPERLGQNVNTVHTLIPRHHEPDQPVGTGAGAPPTPAELALAAAAAAAGTAPPGAAGFVFDDGGRSYTFAKATPWDPAEQVGASLRRSLLAGGVGAEAAWAAWPYTDAQTRLFRFNARLHRIAQRVGRALRHERQAAAEAAGAGAAVAAGAPRPAPRKLVWKYLSARREAESAELARMLAAHQVALPWSAPLGMPAGGFGNALVGSGGPSGLFGALAHANRSGVLFSPVGAGAGSAAFPGVAGAGATATAALGAPFQSGSGFGLGFGFGSIVPAAAAAAAAGSFGPQPPQKLPASFAPSAIAASPAAGSEGSAPAAAPASPRSAAALADLEASFARSMRLNPFRAPEQLERLDALVEADHAAAAAQAARRDEEKAQRRKRREERSTAAAAAAAAAPGFSLKGADGVERFYPAEGSAQFGKRTAPLSATQALPASRTAAERALALAATSGAPVDYRSGVFGRASNPYSQTHAFEKWCAWNARHAAFAAAVPAPPAAARAGRGAAAAATKYKFQPEPVRHLDGLDTSEEDDDEEEEAAGGAFAFRSPAASSSSSTKRKLGDGEMASATLGRSSPFEIGLDSTRNIVLSPFGTGAQPQHLHPHQQQRQQQGFRSASLPRQQRRPSRSPAGRRAARSRSQSPAASSFARPQEREARRRDRERERERSLSPFSYHARPRSPPVAPAFRSGTSPSMAATAAARSDALYPPHRSSVAYYRGGDAGAPLMHDPLAAFGHSLGASPASPFSHSHQHSLQAELELGPTVADPSGLGGFHTGFSASSGAAGFLPFSASFPGEHSSANAFPVRNALSPSPAKRLKAVRRDRGSKRAAAVDDAGGAFFAATAGSDRRDGAEELEWEAALERDEWRRQQDEAARLRTLGAHAHRASRTMDLARSGQLYGTTQQLQQSQPQAQHPYGGVNVHIHGGTATATVAPTASHSSTSSSKPRGGTGRSSGYGARADAESASHSESSAKPTRRPKAAALASPSPPPRQQQRHSDSDGSSDEEQAPRRSSRPFSDAKYRSSAAPPVAEVGPRAGDDDREEREDYEEPLSSRAPSVTSSALRPRAAAPAPASVAPSSSSAASASSSRRSASAASRAGSSRPPLPSPAAASASASAQPASSRGSKVPSRAASVAASAVPSPKLSRPASSSSSSSSRQRTPQDQSQSQSQSQSRAPSAPRTPAHPLSRAPSAPRTPALQPSSRAPSAPRTPPTPPSAFEARRPESEPGSDAEDEDGEARQSRHSGSGSGSAHGTPPYPADDSRAEAPEDAGLHSASADEHAATHDDAADKPAAADAHGNDGGDAEPALDPFARPDDDDVVRHFKAELEAQRRRAGLPGLSAQQQEQVQQEEEEEQRSSRASSRPASGTASRALSRSASQAPSQSASQSASAAPSRHTSRRSTVDSSSLARAAAVAAAAVPLPVSSSSTPVGRSRGASHASSRSSLAAPLAGAVAVAAAAPATPPSPPRLSVFGWQSHLHTDELSPALRPKPVLTSDSLAHSRSPSRSGSGSGSARSAHERSHSLSAKKKSSKDGSPTRRWL